MNVMESELMHQIVFAQEVTMMMELTLTVKYVIQSV